jgi:hypothetical protein
MADERAEPEVHRIANLEWVARGVLGCVVVACVAALVWTWSLGFASCPVEDLTGPQKAAVAELTDIVKWTLSLSVGIIALFGSLAFGLKEGPKFTSTAWLLLVAAMCCFAFAAYFALMWRVGVAEAFFNGCPALITSKMLIVRFNMVAYLFLAGLGILAATLCLVTFERNRRKS